MTEAVLSNIKRIMKIEGVTRSELAIGINIGFNSLSNMLDNLTKMNDTVLYKIIEYLQVSISEIQFGFSAEREVELSRIKDKKFLDELLSDCDLTAIDVNYEDLLANVNSCGENLKNFCELKNISQSTLATSIGISRRQLVRYINGTSKCKPEILKLAVMYLHISIIDLILGVCLDERMKLAKKISPVIPNVGRNIREICMEKWVTYHNEFSQTCNINIHKLLHALYDTRKLNVYDLERIANALNVSIEYILFKNIDIIRKYKSILSAEWHNNRRASK